MTEITRVPLQPIAKGGLAKLWLGVAAALLVAGGIAWASVPASVRVDTLVAGEGLSPTREDVALINYKGTLEDGKVFDEGKQVPLALSEVIPGFTQALEQMQRGGKYRVAIPSELAYGNEQAGEIPPGSDLTFEIELIDFKSRAEIEQQQRIIQQMQQMQGGGVPTPPIPGGGPGGSVPLPPQP